MLKFSYIFGNINSYFTKKNKFILSKKILYFSYYKYFKWVSVLPHYANFVN